MTETLDALQIVDKWSKNNEFSQYVKALEEWDEIIGDTWEGNDERYLSIVGWLREQNRFKGFKNYIRSSIGRTFDAVQLYIDQHKDILSYYERNSRADMAILANPTLQDQATVFESVY